METTDDQKLIIKTSSLYICGIEYIQLSEVLLWYKITKINALGKILVIAATDDKLLGDE